MPETMWERTKHYSGTAYSKALKPGFDKAWNTLDKLGAPVNRLSNRLGAEAFWPTTLDKESDKAARILRSFCKDGFYNKVDENEAKKAADSGEKIEGPIGKQRVLKKIPEKVIRQAKGLAIFTTMRTGLWVSGAGGSGVLVARHQETGEWSPPSGILLHTAGLGFLVGVDIYDCVVVINTYKALEAFTHVRCTLGGEVSAVAGPVGMGGVLESELHKRQTPVWTYLKSRGFYAGVQVDGTIIIERTDENEKFYGERIPVADILAGKARHPPKQQYKMLMDTIKAAQGDDVDENLLPDPGQAPGDMEIETEGSNFGVPDKEDPDPYGVKALEAEGLNIREAGTHSRPSAEAFEFRPSPTSPIYNNFARRSADSPLRGRTNSWRGSTHSLGSVDRATQTAEKDLNSTSRSPVHKIHSRELSPARKETEHVNDSDDQEDTLDRSDSLSGSDTSAVIEMAVPVIAQARVVTVPKRVPPALPPRNPGRIASPLQEGTAMDGFDRVSLNGSEHSSHERVQGNPVDEAKTEEKILEGDHSVNGTTRGGDDDFHSIPATPDEHRENIPGAFN